MFPSEKKETNLEKEDGQIPEVLSDSDFKKIKKSVANKKNLLDSIFGNIFKKNSNSLVLLETDLIKDEVEIKFNYKKDLIILVVLFFISLIIVTEMYILLDLWEEKKEKENSHYLEKEISYMIEKSDSVKSEYDNALDFNNRLRISSMSLNNHIYWSNFFSFLETNTLKNVYYKSFSGDIYGPYILPSVSDDVLAISFQTKIFSSDQNVLSANISDEKIINNEDDGGGALINFNLNIGLDSKIFN